MSEEPTEVALLKETRSCRSCMWFWGPEPPYGPFPSFRFARSFPEEVGKARTLPLAQGPARWLDGKGRGLRTIEPAVLHGCRKAPIMTIGINPNLGGFYPTPDGARYVYPDFGDDEAAYAYYYRHRGVCQEQVDDAKVRSWLSSARSLASPTSGVVVAVTRGLSHRYAEFHVAADDGRTHVYELAWRAGEAPAILVQKGERVAAGQLLAGFIEPSQDETLDIFAKPVGYYERFQLVLRRLEALRGWPTGTLSIGEDVSQGDMVACASPGWAGTAGYDLADKRIVANCATDKRFLLRQLLQSQPAVIVFSGSTALRMFSEVWPGEPWLREWSMLDTQQALQRCTTEPRYLQVTTEDVEFRARILCAGHFSYKSNFVRGARLSREAWDRFRSRFPKAARSIIESGLLREELNDKLLVNMEQDDLHQVLGEEAWSDLHEAPAYSDPVDQLASALAAEVEQGSLSLNAFTGRLTRARGGCRYCVNERWTFPEGCAYESATAAATVPAHVTRALADRIGRAPISAANALRVWRGVRHPDVTETEFDRQMKEVFIPATVEMMAPLGLIAYHPTRLAQEHGGSGLIEVALVAYRTREAYGRARQTDPGKSYGALHARCFAFASEGAPAQSRSDFTELWPGATMPGKPYSLYDLPLDLQRGRTTFHMSRVAPEQLPALETFLTGLRANKPSALTGYFFVLEEDGLFLRWAHFADGSVVALAEPTPPLLHAETLGWPLPAAAEARSDTPFSPGKSLNVLFERPDV